jgi:hypothetical protein
MQLVPSFSSPPPHYTQDKFTSSLVTLISVSEIKSIYVNNNLDGTNKHCLKDYWSMEPFLEIPITGKLT